MKNKKNRAKPSRIVALQSYMTGVEMDSIVLAFAQIIPVEKPQDGEDFAKWIVATINKIAGDSSAVRKIIEHLESSTKVHSEHVERLSKHCRDKDNLLRVLLPHYLKSIG
jgi:hypothetical protein